MWGTTEGREGLGSQSVPQSRPPHLHADMETGCPGGTRQQRCWEEITGEWERETPEGGVVEIEGLEEKKKGRK